MPQSVNGGQTVLFAPRFIEKHAGKRMLTDPCTALIELVANSWDAGATRVDISWPGPNAECSLQVKDNGHGLEEQQLLYRWRTLAYDRLPEQGSNAEFPPGVDLPPRPAFGRNGVGRFAAFCFGEAYSVESWRDGSYVKYLVSKGEVLPFELSRVDSGIREGHGTNIGVETAAPVALTSDTIREEIGSRFLTDPDFHVFVNDQEVTFDDLADERHQLTDVAVEPFGSLRIAVVLLPESDRTTRQHGIAWHVNGRLVGDCTWGNFNDRAFIDGRTTVARRFSFIVYADFLVDAVLQDWSGFVTDNEAYTAANNVVCDWIRSRILDEMQDRRTETFERIKKQQASRLSSLTRISQRRWDHFVSNVQEECPNLSERDLFRVAEILAKMELADSKYSLIEKLHSLECIGIDDLNEILNRWTVDTAKEVLGELELRLKLLEELKHKVIDEDADELHELQPLFERGLWIFGPEYETIEYTSNVGMTRVIQELLGGNVTGSRNRPDFVVRPDTTVGLYSYPQYDEEGGEVGVDRLVVVELKRAGISIGDEQKQQCWRYIKELYEKGLLLPNSRVTAFVLGTSVETHENAPRTEKGGLVNIRPLLYPTVVNRAESRLFKLHDRVRNAPFLEAVREELGEPLQEGVGGL